MLIKEFDKETEKILDERIVERRKIEREIIDANIADRDQRRIDKQELEDKGWGGFVIGRPSEPIEIIEELPQATYENPPEEEPIEELKEAKEDWSTKEHMEIDLTNARKIILEPPVETIIEEIPLEWTDTSAPIPDATFEPTIPYEELEPTIDDIIEDRDNIAESLRNTADEINNETKTIKDLNPEWIEDYKTETGKNAIWRGSITKGFKEYMKEIYDINL